MKPQIWFHGEESRYYWLDFSSHSHVRISRFKMDILHMNLKYFYRKLHYNPDTAKCRLVFIRTT